MAKLALSGQEAKSRQLTAEAERQAERMRDVQLLLDHMLRQEAVTIKFILDCLYDVGSVNLINQKFRAQPLNQLMKAIAVMSKPAFKPFALRWLYKNCPRLITNWLHRKVRFNAPDTQPAVTVTKVIEAQETPAPLPAPLTDPAAPAVNIPLAGNLAPTTERDRQIRQLQQQVRWLTGMLVGVVLLWGGSVLLPHYNVDSGAAQSQENVHRP
ncbi:MAG: hypothetical protein KME42_18375 [Tildeniella nuda ZEHNDER 1965/U140]|jgi:hypothetical protein|nr:hypothetical protein [Tildeniella nuda ZEHNDER 1965/U140]